ncbi:AAA family ATPase [Tenuibacillus multivorans]|uniref:MoxR-like ATPase n=1 Tax=Tenuibacillus multivorans TaxID=237069 RepID=A0A1H0E2Z9_9BACI|nr:MoxR family ATPase [Tenuibacillus multivorans]GEL76677.1 magnesium chelatase [Tenuibacillus multivorans]SDN76673.1 MoxR-like ATPase [Tenuibacillus multivorans]
MTQQMTAQQSKVEQLLDNMEKVMVGNREAIELSLLALLAEGHVLLEDVPGVGKTMLVRALAKSFDLEFKRIQFTPDLLPSDVTGVSIYNQKEMNFEFRPGPILGNIVLADEINRTSPKTQSALLESMEERNITVDGTTMELKRPFFVMATQNPIEYEGTYPLPEAQLDRFLLKLSLGYPTKDEEIQMLDRTSSVHPIDRLDAVMQKEDLIQLQEEVKDVYVSDAIKKYIVYIVNGTRTHPLLELGASPRASISMMKAAKAYAFIQKRDYVLPDDIKHLTSHVLGHRVIISSEAKFEGKTPASILNDIVKKTIVPIERG